MINDDSFEPRPGIPIDETETDLCRALWLAVAVQALIDATSGSRKKPAIKNKSNALKWLAENEDVNSDFETVCDLANIDPKDLRKMFKEIRRDPSRSLDFRCLKRMENGKRGVESRKRYFARARKNEQLRKKRPIKDILHTPQRHVKSICPLVTKYREILIQAS